MSQDQPQYLQRASFDGALCTIRCQVPEGVIANARGEWLGVEWDDPRRGKHDGFYNGQRIFYCQSNQPKVASFIKTSRKPDDERTVLEAIRHKYGSGSSHEDMVVISGKVAEEVGFDKIAQEQSAFESLKIVVLEKLVIYGLAPRGSSEEDVVRAQTQLAVTCPNIVELDLGYNILENWSDVWDICVALPKLRTLRLNGLRLRSLTDKISMRPQVVFPSMKELHLNECLMTPSEMFKILGPQTSARFPNLEELWMSQNEWNSFLSPVVPAVHIYGYESVRGLILEKNFFTSLDSLRSIIRTFPNLKHLSLQNNHINAVSEQEKKGAGRKTEQYPLLESISLSSNKITAFGFIDELASMLPNLSALRISKNPLYDEPQSSVSTANPSETNYYLTLARLPFLKTLNYTHITPREREEGEIYFLSVAEQDIKTNLLQSIPQGSKVGNEIVLSFVRSKYPRYQELCAKHDRESIVTKICGPSPDFIDQILKEESKPKLPPGSIAANLVEANFRLDAGSNQQHGRERSTNTTQNLSQRIPLSIPTSQIFALVARTFNLAPLQFKLIYESHEFDPVHADITTKSQLYYSSANKVSTADRYQSWGDWDADATVEASKANAATNGQQSEASQREQVGQGVAERWSEEGYLLKDGRRWQRREVEILMGLRSWGDWLDSGADSVNIRVEKFGK